MGVRKGQLVMSFWGTVGEVSRPFEWFEGHTTNRREDRCGSWFSRYGGGLGKACALCVHRTGLAPPYTYLIVSIAAFGRHTYPMGFRLSTRRARRCKAQTLRKLVGGDGRFLSACFGAVCSTSRFDREV